CHMNKEYYFHGLLDKFSDYWHQISSDKTGSSIQPDRKENDRNLINLKKTFIKWLDNGNQLADMKTIENQNVIKEKVIHFMTSTLKVDEWVCRLLDNEGYYKASHRFIEMAKDLIENISFDEIFQALRNVWVIIALQIYMDAEVKLTDSIFAYSMLYPLTDNYLDNPDISMDEKQSFNKRFYQKIHNNIDQSVNGDEKRIFRMIDLIESDFPRSEYPDVFEGLLAILDAQRKSLDQHKENKLNEEELLKFTLYKGGTSVLADAFLVRGVLTDDEAAFAYGYGIILQLADDLQDIEEDLKNLHDTPYNRLAAKGILDNFYNKHENFINYFMNDIFNQSNKKQKALYQLLEKSIMLLLFGGVSDNKKYFSKKYLKEYWEKSV
ncbi:MAG: class 1 isoprenoid biosynthesis enzyme, partial [Desulfobacteraceae bacterium]|nr:class 1 isoprenoid biosynthesis enzyme [Desulfobacteraceae bacterium]